MIMTAEILDPAFYAKVHQNRKKFIMHGPYIAVLLHMHLAWSIKSTSQCACADYQSSGVPKLACLITLKL